MEYCSFVLVNFLIGIVIGGSDLLIIGLGGLTEIERNIFTLSNLFSIALLVPNLAVSVRRFHDTNKPSFVPVFLTLFWFIYSLSASYITMFASGYMENADFGLMAGIFITIGVLMTVLAIYALIVNFTHGTHGPNQYGPDPKQPNLGDELDQIGVE